MMIAESFSYVTQSPDGSKVIQIEQLKDLTIGQLQDLCKKLGLKGCQNSPKFEMQSLIASLINNKATEANIVSAKTRDSLWLSGYLCHFINCLFCSQHCDNWFSLNDIKN